MKVVCDCCAKVILRGLGYVYNQEVGSEDVYKKLICDCWAINGVCLVGICDVEEDKDGSTLVFKVRPCRGWIVMAGGEQHGSVELSTQPCTARSFGA